MTVQICEYWDEQTINTLVSILRRRVGLCQKKPRESIVELKEWVKS